jgi:hypothetical protein
MAHIQVDGPHAVLVTTFDQLRDERYFIFLSSAITPSTKLRGSYEKAN